MKVKFTANRSWLNISGILIFALFLNINAFAQLQIKGKVTNASKEGIPGVSIIVKDSKRYAITDEQGNFVIQNALPTDVLTVSYTGYTSQKITIGNSTFLTITLQEDTKLLNDVVIIGYGAVKKSDVTGAIASVKPNAIEASKAVSVENLLQGKIAGVAVSNSSSSPGAAVSVNIRGANSLRGDNQPLYIIDNIPQGSTGNFASSAVGGGDFQIATNPLTNLNPNDIEDIQVLKDASATAIYGSRGANGVIIVTTKKGQKGKARVALNTNFSFAQPTNFRDMLSLSEYASFRNEKTGTGALQFYTVGDDVRYVFSGGVYDPNDPASYNLVTERNWQKEIYRNAASQSYNLTVNGGENTVKYYLSADYKSINGLIKQTGLKQGGLRLNLSGDLSKRLAFNFSMSGNFKENNMMTGGNTRGGVTGSIARTAIDSAPFEIPANDPTLVSNEEARTTTLSWLTDYDDISKEQSGRTSADLTWKISNHFSYTIRSGANLLLQERSRWYGVQLFQGLNANGLLAISKTNSSNYTVENLLNYNGKVGEILNINATAGVTYDDYNWLAKSTSASNFQFKDLRVNGLQMASIINELQPAQRDYQLLSYLSRVNFSFFGGKYLATITARADGSSKFKAGNRWALFPSTALAWRLDQEKWIKDVSWIDQIKIRLGYGKTGSQSISPYNSFYNYGQIVDYASPTGTKQLAIAVNNLQNSDLKWETTSAYNAGLDFTLWKGVLSGNVDAYVKTTNDLLIEKNLPASTAFNTLTLNQGSLRNKGLELALNSEVIRSKNFSWSLSGNIGINRSQILDLGLPEVQFGNERYKAYLGNSIGDQFGVANIFIVGKAPGLFWGYKTNGIIQTEDTGLPTSTIFTQKPGNIKVVDVNGDGVINENDKTIIGNPNAKFNYGFQTAFSFKALKLSATFYGVKGGQVLNGNVRYEQTPSIQTANLTSTAFANAWRANAQSNLYPAVNSTLQNVVYDRYVEDGSFLRCSDITLAYSIPKQVFNNKIGGINLFASVKNAFVITGYSGYDPEMRSFSFDGLRPGIDLNSFSNPREFVFGLNVAF